MPEKRFPEGIYFNPPRDGAPDYVVGSVSMKSVVFLEWLNGEQPNEKGFVNLDVLLSKETGKPYLVVNDFKPGFHKKSSEEEEDMPF